MSTPRVPKARGIPNEKAYEALRLQREGLQRKAIAERLGLTLSTVAKYLIAAREAPRAAGIR